MFDVSGIHAKCSFLLVGISFKLYWC